MAVYTVVKGDTLSHIAVRYNTTVKKLVEINNIKNPDLIYIGQKIETTGSAPAKTKTTTYKADITAFGLLSTSSNQLFATWDFDKKYIDKYQIRWKYQVAGGAWFYGNSSSISVDEHDPAASQESLYTIPEGAVKVSFEVKPISKTYQPDGKTDVYYWKAEWSNKETYKVSTATPAVPNAPSLSIDGLKLTSEVTNISSDIVAIDLEIVEDNERVIKLVSLVVRTTQATYSCAVKAGHKYKARCRGKKPAGLTGAGTPSEWSTYSQNVETIPPKVSRAPECIATSSTSVRISWYAVSTAESFDIQYATKKEYLDSSDQATTVSSIIHAYYEKTGLETGTQYFFRVRYVNKAGAGAWSDISTVVLGKKPAPPTTWSSTTTVIAGESLNLYWVHNAEDGSRQTHAEIELYINDVKVPSIMPDIPIYSEEEDEKVNVYSFDTSKYEDGAKVLWRVRTSGITNVYSDWSVQRTVDIYAQPYLSYELYDAHSNHISDIVESYPFYVKCIAEGGSQIPIGYYITITADSPYETVDYYGNTKFVNKGESVYYKYFDTSEELVVEFSASNVNLENNVDYIITCVAAMNSGLTVEASYAFTVRWTDIEYVPNAEIGIDSESFTACIRPYCEDADGNIIENVLLSVYRREVDGRLTEIASNIENSDSTFVTDPHPSLDYARYRIVSITKDTGAISYYDIPAHVVGGKSIIIQWDEEWTSLETFNKSEPVERAWTGSMLKLPYNIRINNDYKKDVTHIKYVGRTFPVSYYGTQIDETPTWSVDIDKNDTETIYALRRLAIWSGNVYVREPSGCGYWASIEVSFSQKHLDVTIPVTLSITRVDGGV